MEAKRRVMVGLLGVWGLFAVGNGSPSFAGEGKREARPPGPNVRDGRRRADPAPAPEEETTTPPPVLFVISPDKEGAPAADTRVGQPSPPDARVDTEGRAVKAAKVGAPAQPRGRLRSARATALSERATDDLALTPALVSGPSREERGRVGAVTFSDFHAGIEEATPDPGALVEQVVEPAPLDGDGPKRRQRVGLISQAALEQQLRQQLPTLNACRVEIARQQALPWSAVAAGRVTLQWTILPTGGVSNANVVAIDPLDLYLQDCVLRRMRQWTFVRTSGSTVPMSRPFEFR